MENTEQTKQTGKSQAAEREEKILAFWDEREIFDKTLAKASPAGEFVFYEGPPTANGKPGIHHLEGRAFKDAIPRYKTMRGYHVRRKGGWDTHGLPVELQVEKKLGLKSKKEIESYGIAKFNQECKESVWEYRDIWEKFTTRIGYWVDQKNPYVTYHNSYIESVWNVLSRVEDRDLLYKDYKVLPWCPRCGTALSSHELAQGYEDVKDLSVIAKFSIIGFDKAYFLAWTTTPWTLPGNVALAVGKDIEYVEAKVGEEILVLAKDLLSKITEPYEIIAEHKGSEMVGMAYEPLYPFLKDNLPEKEKAKLDKAFKVHAADFVTTTEGTGIVHIAPMYGNDDFDLATRENLPKYHVVNDDGTFKDGMGNLSGRFVKDEAVAVDIIKDLAGRNLLFKKEKYEHSYPHCWRCHTPLIYYARDSWYIRMSALRDEMVGENQDIHWEPAHIQGGRFGEWLKDIKDWAISRERYWGTPLPIWQCTSCHKHEVIGSIDELKAKTKKSGNTYIVMRHGESEYNIERKVSADQNNRDPLTANGEAQVRASAEELKDEKFDLIIASPFLRTRQTAEIVADTLGYDRSKILFDDRLVEMNPGDFGLPGQGGTTWQEYHAHVPKTVGNFNTALPGGESYREVKKRVTDALYDFERTYQNKKILIVSHGAPLWLLFAGRAGHTAEQALGVIVHMDQFLVMKNAECRPLAFTPIPHDQWYELDLHKPFIDECALVCDCGGDMTRVKEVMDVWFDSGAMPFAQDHYPFGSTRPEEGDGASLTTGEQKILYPADFISEGIDQTRGWFYTLHAIGVLMGRGKAYKNVICLGLILDAEGKKMSKSVGNVVDPMEMINKYGVDTLRLWMYSVNQPGDAKNFDEKTVAELHNKVFNLLYNVLAFYELYRDVALESEDLGTGTKNVLDTWIIARLNQLVALTTENLDAYKLLEPVRATREFIDDLSTWYVRRNRDRIKDGDRDAKKTLYFVLKTLSKLIAPFAPFAAEDIWQKLKNADDVESVHLAKWPISVKYDEDVLLQMQVVRDYSTTGHMLRKKINQPVKQPLATFSVPIVPPEGYIQLLQDELNVKSVEKNEVMMFDPNITLALKAEGDLRELIRAIQDMRKKMNLLPSDMISLVIETDETGKLLIAKFENELKKTVLAKEIIFAANEGSEIKIDSLGFKIAIVK